MDQKRPTAVVRVSVHCLSDGRTMVGIMGQEFSGPRRVDVRLTQARETAAVCERPPGVNRAVWEAYCGLADLVDEQAIEWLEKQERINR